MGCASSGPIGKAADSVMDLANKEGKAVQDFGAATKDTLVSGVNHVNEMVGTAFKSAEEEIAHVTSKATNFLGHADDKIDDMKKEVDQIESNVSDNVNEAISDAETVVMSEVNNVHNDVGHLSDGAMESMQSMQKDVVETTERMAIMDGDNLILEDIEHFDHHLGESVEKTQRKVEKLMEVDTSDAKDLSEEVKKE